MPKSKRERKSALTQVKKKGRAVKDALVSKIREAVQTYPHVFVFDVKNMKNQVMKEVREEWKGSKFFLGKNKVMQLALGKTPEEEQKPGMAKLANHISGTRGLLFTHKTQADVEEYFATFRAAHFARSGFVCTASYKLAAGTLPADRCPHPIEPLLRKVGLPTKLVQGKVELLNDVAVAAKGDVLTPEQCKIMQIFGVKLAQFRLHCLYAWTDGQVTEVEGESADEEAAAGGDDEAEGKEADEEAAIELRDVAGEGEAYVEEEEEAAAAEDDEDM